MGAGDSSEDEEGWRVAERHCIDHRAAYDMEEIIDNVFMRATEFMHQSGLRMDEDRVGKPQDLYFGALWMGARIGVSGVARSGSRPVVLAQSALPPRRRNILFFSFTEIIRRSAILARG